MFSLEFAVHLAIKKEALVVRCHSVDIQHKLNYFNWVTILEGAKEHTLVSDDADAVSEITSSKLTNAHCLVGFLKNTITIVFSTQEGTTIKLHFVVGCLSETLNFFICQHEAIDSLEIVRFALEILNLPILNKKAFFVVKLLESHPF